MGRVWHTGTDGPSEKIGASRLRQLWAIFVRITTATFGRNADVTSVEGETTLFYLMNRLREFSDLKVTSIARGIGFGDELEYVDELTLTHALLNRRAVE